MVKLVNLVEGAISFTLKFLENSKEDPSFDAEKYLIDKYKISKLCASRFYRPVFWAIFQTLADNPIGKIGHHNKNGIEFYIKRNLGAEEISNLSEKIIKEHGEYYKSNAEINKFPLEI